LWNPFLWRVHLLFLLLLLRLLLLLHHASADVLLLLVDGEFFTFENLTIFIKWPGIVNVTPANRGLKPVPGPCCHVSSYVPKCVFNVSLPLS
jgi:hypothetical protein